MDLSDKSPSANPQGHDGVGAGIRPHRSFYNVYPEKDVFRHKKFLQSEFSKTWYASPQKIIEVFRIFPETFFLMRPRLRETSFSFACALP